MRGQYVAAENYAFGGIGQKRRRETALQNVL